MELDLNMTLLKPPVSQILNDVSHGRGRLDDTELLKIKGERFG